MKNLLVYDFLQALGGAENLSLTLCNNLNDLDLLVSYINQQNYPELTLLRNDLLSLNTEYTHPVLQAVFISRAFSKLSLDIDNYDKVMFSGSYAPLAVAKRKKRKGNYLYCHTPPRFAYDLHENYLDSLSRLQKPLFRLLVAWFKPQYEQAIEQMDLIIANSANVQARIRHYLNRDSEIVYPPINTDKFQWLGQQDYFLSTARLEPYKRVDLIVRAFMQMPDRKLVVASGGSQLQKLQAMARESGNISFTGWTSDEQLKQLVGNAMASIYLPIDEDFGMSPVESMAAGKPVIGVNDGGIKETVADGKTGFLLPQNFSVNDIVAQVSAIEAGNLLAMKQDCIDTARSFDTEIFVGKMRKLLS